MFWMLPSCRSSSKQIGEERVPTRPLIDSLIHALASCVINMVQSADISTAYHREPWWRVWLVRGLGRLLENTVPLLVTMFFFFFCVPFLSPSWAPELCACQSARWSHCCTKTKKASLNFEQGCFCRTPF